jgi:hypothetical protein
MKLRFYENVGYPQNNASVSIDGSKNKRLIHQLVSTFRLILSLGGTLKNNDQVKESVMARACSTDAGEEKCL